MTIDDRSRSISVPIRVVLPFREPSISTGRTDTNDSPTRTEKRVNVWKDTVSIPFCPHGQNAVSLRGFAGAHEEARERVPAGLRPPPRVCGRRWIKYRRPTLAKSPSVGWLATQEEYLRPH